MRVDIRMWVPAYPCKRRGISLTVAEFNKLYKAREELTQCLQEIVYYEDYNDSFTSEIGSTEEEQKMRHWVQLSELLQAETKSPWKCVNIRRWFTPLDGPEGDFRPGYGVALNSYEWFHLWQGMEDWIDILGEEFVGFADTSVGAYMHCL